MAGEVLRGAIVARACRGLFCAVKRRALVASIGAGLGLLLGSAALAQTNAAPDAFAKRRSDATQEMNRQIATCRSQFVSSPCVDEAQRKGKAQLRAIQQEETQVKAAQRQKRADEQQERLTKAAAAPQPPPKAPAEAKSPPPLAAKNAPATIARKPAISKQPSAAQVQANQAAHDKTLAQAQAERKAVQERVDARARKRAADAAKAATPDPAKPTPAAPAKP
jgi:colicin import membrane protein